MLKPIALAVLLAVVTACSGGDDGTSIDPVDRDRERIDRDEAPETADPTEGDDARDGDAGDDEVPPGDDEGDAEPDLPAEDGDAPDEAPDENDGEGPDDETGDDAAENDDAEGGESDDDETAEPEPEGPRAIVTVRLLIPAVQADAARALALWTGVPGAAAAAPAATVPLPANASEGSFVVSAPAVGRALPSLWLDKNRNGRTEPDEWFFRADPADFADGAAVDVTLGYADRDDALGLITGAMLLDAPPPDAPDAGPPVALLWRYDGPATPAFPYDAVFLPGNAAVRPYAFANVPAGGWAVSGAAVVCPGEGPRPYAYPNNPLFVELFEGGARVHRDIDVVVPAPACAQPDDGDEAADDPDADDEPAGDPDEGFTRCIDDSACGGGVCHIEAVPGGACAPGPCSDDAACAAAGFSGAFCNGRNRCERRRNFPLTVPAGPVGLQHSLWFEGPRPMRAGLRLRLAATADDLSGLAVRLESPAGLGALVQYRELSGVTIDREFAINDFVGAAGAGYWVLIVTDETGRSNGRIDAWSLTFLDPPETDDADTEPESEPDEIAASPCTTPRDIGVGQTVSSDVVAGAYTFDTACGSRTAVGARAFRIRLTQGRRMRVQVPFAVFDTVLALTDRCGGAAVCLPADASAVPGGESVQLTVPFTGDWYVIVGAKSGGGVFDLLVSEIGGDADDAEPDLDIEGPLPIPDASSAGVAWPVDVTAPDCTISAVRVTVGVTHPRRGDLSIVLDRAGARFSELLPVRPGDFNPYARTTYFVDDAFVGGGFGGLRSVGRWTLTVTDNAAGETGTLDDWSLEFVCP